MSNTSPAPSGESYQPISTWKFLASICSSWMPGRERNGSATREDGIEMTAINELTEVDALPQSDLVGRPRWSRKWPKPDFSKHCTVITEEHVHKYLAESWKDSWKWLTLSILAVVQVSMNFNASVYGNAVQGLTRYFNVSTARALQGQWLFLIFYAFGCELWAPWSEDFGRHIVLQASLWAVNIWQLMGGASQSISSVIASRVLGGLSSAGGSVTLGVVADMYKPEEAQEPVAFVVYWSVMGSVVGPVFGALIQKFVYSWRWIFWTQLLLGSVTALLHLVAPETRSTVLVKRFAQDLRVKGKNVATQQEYEKKKLTIRDCYEIWIRPFHMFLCEPVVLCLSLLSGFSDALIFLFLEAYGEVYGTLWGFGTIGIGMAFIPLAVGYTIGYWLHCMDIRHQQRERKDLQTRGLKMRLERKLYLLLYTAPLEFVGLLIFGICSIPTIGAPWLVPMLASVLVGIANFSIYMATIDYMVEAYGPYASSATGGNGFARDLLAGISALYAKPLYRQVGRYPLMSGSIILAGTCLVVLMPIYIFYIWGEKVQQRSKFMKMVREEREQKAANRSSAAATTLETIIPDVPSEENQNQHDEDAKKASVDLTAVEVSENDDDSSRRAVPRSLDSS